MSYGIVPLHIVNGARAVFLLIPEKLTAAHGL